MDGSSATRSKSKLWLGFGLMCAGVLVWALMLKWAMNSVGPFPTLSPTAKPDEIDQAMRQMGNPMSMLAKMAIGYAGSAVVGIGGVVVTAMGLIDYAAEVRRRGSNG